MSKLGSWQQLLGESSAGQHIAELYGDERQLVDTVDFYVAEGLRREEAVIVLATPKHWADLVAWLKNCADIDMFATVMRGQLRILDAQITLSTCLKAGEPDWDAFCKTIGGELVRTTRKFPTMRIYGEMVDLLWQQGRHEAAHRIEEFWNALARQQAFSLLCTYGIDKQSADSIDATLKYVCTTHSHLVHRLDRNPDATDSRLDAEALK